MDCWLRVQSSDSTEQGELAALAACMTCHLYSVSALVGARAARAQYSMLTGLKNCLTGCRACGCSAPLYG